MPLQVEQIIVPPATIEVDADFMSRLQAFKERQTRKKQRQTNKAKHAPDMDEATEACFGDTTKDSEK
jgi:hypothetical protein